MQTSTIEQESSQQKCSILLLESDKVKAERVQVVPWIELLAMFQCTVLISTDKNGLVHLRYPPTFSEKNYCQTANTMMDVFSGRSFYVPLANASNTVVYFS